jgi:hypothetical protein
VVDGTPPGVLVHCVRGTHRTIMAVHNLSADPAPLRLDMAGARRVTDAVDHRTIAVDHDGQYDLVLDTFEHRWLVLDDG